MTASVLILLLLGSSRPFRGSVLERRWYLAVIRGKLLLDSYCCSRRVRTLRYSLDVLYNTIPFQTKEERFSSLYFISQLRSCYSGITTCSLSYHHEDLYYLLRDEKFRSLSATQNHHTHQYTHLCTRLCEVPLNTTLHVSVKLPTRTKNMSRRSHRAHI